MINDPVGATGRVPRRNRRSIRLKGYDYSQAGAYFVTICTQGRACLFGDVVDGEMRLNEYGKIVWDEWYKTAAVRPYMRLDEYGFVVMPNHVHAIVWIVDDDMVGARRRRALTREEFGRPISGSLPTIVRAFKSAVTKRINEYRRTPGLPVWQRNYWEHVVRNERALNAIRRYIVENPLRWHMDRYNPNATGTDPMARDLWHLLQDDARSKQT